MAYLSTCFSKIELSVRSFTVDFSTTRALFFLHSQKHNFSVRIRNYIKDFCIVLMYHEKLKNRVGVYNYSHHCTDIICQYTVAQESIRTP